MLTLNARPSESGYEWHALNISAALRKLDTDPRIGLTMEEASRRLRKFGPNELAERSGKSPWKILLEQFTAVMILIPLSLPQSYPSCLRSLGCSRNIGHYHSQRSSWIHPEYRAEKAMTALKKWLFPPQKS